MKLIHTLNHHDTHIVVHQKCSSSTHFPNTRVRIKKNQKAKDNHTKRYNYTRIKQATGWLCIYVFQRTNLVFIIVKHWSV